MEQKACGIFNHFLVKCGIDANVLVDLVLYPSSKKYFEQKGYSFPDKFLCTISQAIGEAKGVLINKYDYSLETADSRINGILNEFLIEKIKTLPINDDIALVEEIGKKFNLNEADIPIIYNFWKQGVKMIIVRDTAFEKTCQELNIIIIHWPKF